MVYVMMEYLVYFRFKKFQVCRTVSSVLLKISSFFQLNVPKIETQHFTTDVKIFFFFFTTSDGNFQKYKYNMYYILFLVLGDSCWSIIYFASDKTFSSK